VYNPTETYSICNCVSDVNCHTQTGFINASKFVNYNFFDLSTIDYIIPGVIVGCSVLDSCLLSTLECFYSSSNCLPMIKSYINQSFEHLSQSVSWFDPQPLIESSLTNRFLPNTSLSVIAKAMMVEQWGDIASFNQYYEACAPRNCTYSYIARTYNHIQVIIKMVSMLGGLIVTFRLISPRLVVFFSYIFKRKIKRQQQQGNDNRVRRNFVKRIKLTVANLCSYIYKKLIDLDLFSEAYFGHNISATRAKRLSQLTTRLYIVLIIICLIISILHMFIHPQILTKIITEPSLNIYKQFSQKYADTFQCSCSQTSIIHDKYTTIVPIFHQICSNSFILDEWKFNLTAYARNDYRRFIFAHLQFLTGLCALSNQIINAFIDQLFSSLFLGTQLLSESILSARINGLIKTSESTASSTLNRLIFLLRSINHGTALISTYGSNFQYIRNLNTTISYAMSTQPMIYENNCSCGLNATCISPATFVMENSSETIRLKGLNMGCTPTESFLVSTLECFYDLTCINLLQTYTTESFQPLLMNNSKFAIKTPMIDLVNHLFIENWSVTINYSLYFQQCAPAYCSYIYVQQMNSLYTITTILSIYGGLSVILKLICPLIAYCLSKTYQRCQRQTNHNIVHVTTILSYVINR